MKMLETIKSTNLQGTSKINGVVAANYSATVNDVTGAGNIVSSIVNAELYNSNRKECRKDLSDFTNKVYVIEDEMLAEKETEATE